MMGIDLDDLYNQLVASEPIGFIDPFNDLGEFDYIQMKFMDPANSLVNKYSGKPYNAMWIQKIEEMRLLFIAYQKALHSHDQKVNFQRRIVYESNDHLDAIVRTYLELGFNFKEIESRVSISYRQLRRGWKRSDYVKMSQPEFYSKIDLSQGQYIPHDRIPESLGAPERLC
ncbi:modification methylase Sau96I [Streptococcus danieliae]|uniref:modification methylase Sau96I n=1 Tax=Streptococcus danieliae TaxID=747656 RepID=UPI001924EEB3|nr:modification methylase Sau96I [Streptococcus danieliae]